VGVRRRSRAPLRTWRARAVLLVVAADVLDTGGTMRWKPQTEDEANKGLHILKDLMLPVKQVCGRAHSALRAGEASGFAVC